MRTQSAVRTVLRSFVTTQARTSSAAAVSRVWTTVIVKTCPSRSKSPLRFGHHADELGAGAVADCSCGSARHQALGPRPVTAQGAGCPGVRTVEPRGEECDDPTARRRVGRNGRRPAEGRRRGRRRTGRPRDVRAPGQAGTAVHRPRARTPALPSTTPAAPRRTLRPASSPGSCRRKGSAGRARRHHHRTERPTRGTDEDQWESRRWPRCPPKSNHSRPPSVRH